MFDFVNFSAFLTTSLVLIITPGVGFVYVVTKGILTNKWEAFKVSLGIVTLLLIDTVISAIGVAYVINSSKILYNILKYLGIIYLLYLGITTIINYKKKPSKKKFKRYDKSFMQGFIIAITDPQAIAFFVIVIPHFIPDNTKHHVVDALILGGVFSLISLIWLSIVSVLTGSLGKRMENNKYFHRTTKILSGIVLIALAIDIFFTRS
ncbi:LysE family translocator [Aureivirga marina]|uniref:LysE family translocator n=1 Tax=Aureivirga marina TaxID=1182451 RepID=UPI0018CB9331|nr:LysE family translocator [Aureivirga marina]